MSDTQEIARGLEGVVFTESKLTYIDGERGILAHLGIPIQEWAEHSSFEELSCALLNGHLPSQAELDSFDQSLKSLRNLPQPVLEAISGYPKTCHPMQALRTAISHLGVLDPDADDVSPAGRRAIGLKLIAQMSTAIAAIYRSRQNAAPLPPREDLSHAGNFLYMIRGSAPTPEETRLFDMALILQVDHSMNASTFTAIATASTLSDMYSAVTSAIGSLKGPLHGGANEAVMDMLDEIGSVENAAAYITAKLDRHEKIMGVGHRVYKYFDPRSRVLRDYAEVVAKKQGKSRYYQILEVIEKIVVERLGSRGIYPNVDFYSGVVYSDLGIPKPFFTPIFALARISGWVASVDEYTEHNRLLRPTARYVGLNDQHYRPIEQR
jgi:citrate synthase